jgi:AraC-like DNA-binding protein
MAQAAMASLFAPAAITELRARPQFAAAMRAAAAGFVRQHQGDSLLNLLVSDRGRNFAAGMALHLHFASEEGGPALTPAALKAVVQREGVCSPGRATAVVALMQWGGYLVAETHGGRVRRLVPTERLLALHRDRWALQLESLAPMFPRAAEVRRRLTEPKVLRAFAGAQAALFLAGFRAADFAPEVALFAERNAGMVILFSLLLAEPGAGEPPLSLKALARRFRVSRPHVTRLFQEAARAGLFTSADPAAGAALLSPALRDGLERLFAVLFLLNAHCAEQALAGADPSSAAA